jgi:glutamate-1-semialdehyde 2,1-aminomutase
MAAGLAVLETLADDGFHPRLGALTDRLVDGMRACAARHGVPLTTNHVCGMFGFFFTEAERVRSFEDVQGCDVDRFRRFFHAMLARGVYLAPSAFEAGFLSVTHDEAVIDALLEAMDDALAEIA